MSILTEAVRDWERESWINLIYIFLFSRQFVLFSCTLCVCSSVIWVYHLTVKLSNIHVTHLLSFAELGPWSTCRYGNVFEYHGSWGESIQVKSFIHLVNVPTSWCSDVNVVLSCYLAEHSIPTLMWGSWWHASSYQGMFSRFISFNSNHRWQTKLGLVARNLVMWTS